MKRNTLIKRGKEKKGSYKMSHNCSRQLGESESMLTKLNARGMELTSAILFVSSHKEDTETTLRKCMAWVVHRHPLLRMSIKRKLHEGVIKNSERVWTQNHTSSECFITHEWGFVFTTNYLCLEKILFNVWIGFDFF